MQQAFLKTLFFHPAVNGYPILFRPGKAEGSEEEECLPISVTPLPVQIGSLTITSPYGYLAEGPLP